jgi:UDP:flavonoid glycosyltransferase YjiC (YdhE family)
MQLIDEHWIAYPQFVAGPLNAFERFKLGMMKGPVVRYMDTMMPEVGTLESQAIVSRFGLQCDRYVLVVPGGGTGHPGAENGPQVMADAAARLATLGHQIMLVGPKRPASPQHSLLSHVPRLPMADLTALIQQARLVVTNGGDTLLQTLACARACVASAIAGDQVARIQKCVAAGLVVGSRLDARELERAALTLLNDDTRRAGQLAKLERTPIINGIGAAVDAISALAIS